MISILFLTNFIISVYFENIYLDVNNIYDTEDLSP